MHSHIADFEQPVCQWDSKICPISPNAAREIRSRRVPELVGRFCETLPGSEFGRWRLERVVGYAIGFRSAFICARDIGFRRLLKLAKFGIFLVGQFR
jgi:hypothetical protein